eukprot:403336463
MSSMKKTNTQQNTNTTNKNYSSNNINHNYSGNTSSSQSNTNRQQQILSKYQSNMINNDEDQDQEFYENNQSQQNQQYHSQQQLNSKPRKSQQETNEQEDSKHHKKQAQYNSQAQQQQPQSKNYQNQIEFYPQQQQLQMQYQNQSSNASSGRQKSLKNNNQYNFNNQQYEQQQQINSYRDSQKQSSRNGNQKSQRNNNNQNNNKQGTDDSDSSSSNSLDDVDPEDLTASAFVRRFKFADGDEDLEADVKNEVTNQNQTQSQRDNNNQKVNTNKSNNQNQQNQVAQNQYEDENDVSESSSFENFVDQANEYDDNSAGNSDDDSNYHGISKSQRSNRRVIPIEFAKKHIQKIEEDMQRMHERHVKLLREMDENYKLIEKETQEYYLEFLSKWKEVARNKITQYRRAIDQLYTDIENAKRDKEKAVETLNEKTTQHQIEKAKMLKEHNEDLQMRDDEIDQLKSQNRKLERENSEFKYQLGDKDFKIRELHNDMQRLREEYQKDKEDLENENAKLEIRINEYMENLNAKTEENKSLMLNNSSLTQKLQSLDQHLQNISVLSSSGGTMSNGSGLQNQLVQQTQNQSAPRFNMSQIRILNLKQKTDMQNNQIQSQPFSVGKDKISFQKRNNNNDIIKSQGNNNVNNSSFIYQQPTKAFAQSDVKIIGNFNTAKNNQPQMQLNNLKREEHKEAPAQDFLQTQIDNLRKEIQDKTQEYDNKIMKAKSEIQHQAKILSKYKDGSNKVKIPKDNLEASEASKIYSDNMKDRKKFEAEQQQILGQLNQKLNDLIQKQGQQNSLQTPLKSARGSKSMSPRKHQMLKQSQEQQQNRLLNQSYQDDSNSATIKMQPSLNQSVITNDQNSDIKSIDQPTLKQQEFIKEVTNLLRLVDQVIQRLDNHSSTKIMQEVTLLRQKLYNNGQITKDDQMEQFNNQNQEYLKLLEVNNSCKVNMKRFAEIIKNYQEDINYYKTLRKQLGNINPNDLSDVDISRISEVNQSMVSKSQQPSVIMMDEQERQKYQDKINEIGQKAQKGIKMRDDKISQLQGIKEKLKKDLIEKSKAYTDKIQVLEKKISDLQDENQNGEAMLLKQFDDLKKSYEIIKCKHQSEMYQRKMLHNQIEDMKGKIRVFCRVRPLSIEEEEKDQFGFVKVIDGLTIKVPIPNQGMKGGYIQRDFEFDSIFDKDSSQEQVFEDVQMLIQSAMDGFNVCIFAYGQTGSGKTFTMQGNEEKPGIIPRALQELFKLKKKMEQNNFTVYFECYMVELYVNQLIDCLYEKQSVKEKVPNLEIREEQGRTYIENVSQMQIQSLDELYQYYNKGLKTRKVSSTKMNDMSSRSHMIFTVQIQTINEQTKQNTLSKISFVDLAGSERQSKAQGNNERINEANSINQSLLTLGKVVQQLTSGEKHISYKDSKLTQLMKDSLGGNSKTLMFVNISPSEYNIHETKNSILFGQKAKTIVNNVQKNIESQEMIKLKEENEQLKKMLMSTHGGTVITSSSQMMVSQKTALSQKR